MTMPMLRSCWNALPRCSRFATTCAGHDFLTTSVGSTRVWRSIIVLAQPSGSATFAYSPENLRLGKAN